MRNPEYEKLELVNGVLVETGAGGKRHAWAQARCGRLLSEFIADRDDLWLAIALACRLYISGVECYRLPDLAVVAGSPNDGDPRFLEGAPLLVVEVASPDESLAELERKVDEYLANDCKLAWLVRSEEQIVVVCARGASARIFRRGERLHGDAVLPGFVVDVDALFE